MSREIKLDPERCCETFMDNYSSRQCQRKPKIDGYCKQHHPEGVRARQQESDRRYLAKRATSPWGRLEKAKARISELERELAQSKITEGKWRELWQGLSDWLWQINECDAINGYDSVIDTMWQMHKESGLPREEDA